MQDIHPIGGGGGSRIFGGSDRRLRPHLHQSPSLKCPRCDSLNTKFCYYNNYNLSQPRHFCKNCRRYWTKGGILRNVPVGGGCRKSKRARPKPSPSSPGPASVENDGSSSRSSSDSSSLTGANRPPAPAAEAADTTSASTLLTRFSDSTFFLPRPAPISNNNPNHAFHIDRPPSLMLSEIGSFTSLMTDPTILSYNLPPSPSSPFSLHGQQSQEQEQILRSQKLQQQAQQWQLQNKMAAAATTVGEDITAAAGFPNQTAAAAAQIDVQGMHSMTAGNAGFFSTVDWPTSSEQGLFDLPGGVDHGYWGQPHQWADHDQPLYLP